MTATPEQKAETNKRRQENKRLGKCRTCEKDICENSTVFCEQHLIEHRQSCYKYNKKHPVAKYKRIQYRAATKIIDFNMNQTEFQTWLDNQPKTCCYCGVGEDVLKFNPDRKQQRLTIDRKDSKKGYSLENICMACFRCNNSKSDFFTHEEWLRIANDTIKPRLAEYHRLCSR